MLCSPTSQLQSWAFQLKTLFPSYEKKKKKSAFKETMKEHKSSWTKAFHSFLL